MKRYVVFAFLFMFTTLAWADCTEFPVDEINFPEEHQLVETVFTPKGYDVNDDIRLFVLGKKRSPCMGTPYGVIERVGNDIKITIKVRQKVSRDRLCINMAVPFLTDIKLKDLPPGTFNIIVNPDTPEVRFANLEITPAAINSIDDYLYPEVKWLTVDPKTRLVELHGTNPAKCYQLHKTHKIIHTSNGVNTYALMPIMEKIGECDTDHPDDFVYRYQLPHDLHAEKILVHVRTLDGLWKNEVFSPKS